MLLRYTILLLLLASLTECDQDIDTHRLSEASVVFNTGLWYDEGQVIRGAFQPSLISTSKGSVMIFAQGRLNSSEDDTEKVVLFSRSSDNGKTWSTTQFLSKPMPFWGISAFSIIDQNNQEILKAMMVISKPKLFALYTAVELSQYFNINATDYDEESSSILYQLTSIDDGLNWVGSVVNEDFLNKYDDSGNYISFFSPVGQSNQSKEGPNKNRLLLCGPVKYASSPIFSPDDIYDYELTTSTIIYSDDFGASWQMGGLAPHGGNESSVAYIDDGNTLLMIRRRDDDSQFKRIINTSNDHGQTWTENQFSTSLPSPKCLGILYDDGDKLLYCSPFTTGRTHGWIGYSYDDGLTWNGKGIQKGLFSYSDIERIQGSDKFIVAYSLLTHGELGIQVKSFDEEWLLE